MADIDDLIAWYESGKTPWPYRSAAEPEPQLLYPEPSDTIPCSAPDSDEGGLDP